MCALALTMYLFIFLSFLYNIFHIFPQRYRSGRVAHACDGKLLRMLRLFAVIAFALFDIGYNLANSNEDDGVSSTTQK